ncbi:MAG TPA: hypothetical protein VIA45_00415 [Thermoanaerobaculia bacterium]|jgi:hypothetical protein
MLKSFVVGTSLAGLLLASAGSAVEAAEPKAPNIGFVLYTRSRAPGTLNARWNFANKYSGSGLATGGPREGLAGRYHVRYFLDSGEFSDEYDLVIEKTGDFYGVSWLVGGKVSAVGVGMEVQDGLAVGWRRVAD